MRIFKWHISPNAVYMPIMAPTLAGTSVQSAAPTYEICVKKYVLCSLLVMESKTCTHEHYCYIVIQLC